MITKKCPRLRFSPPLPAHSPLSKRSVEITIDHHHFVFLHLFLKRNSNNGFNSPTLSRFSIRKWFYNNFIVTIKIIT